jgi:hypothetical protein
MLTRSAGAIICWFSGSQDTLRLAYGGEGGQNDPPRSARLQGARTGQGWVGTKLQALFGQADAMTRSTIIARKIAQIGTASLPN